ITLLGFSFLIIGILKKSIKEMNGIFENVATGDFTLEIDTNQKNEFGLMKKSLGSTLKDISSMIVNMKNNINNTNNSAGALTNICEQMTAAAQEVAASIQEVAKGSNSQAEDLAKISDIVNDFGKELEATVLSIQNIHENTKKTDAMVSQGNGKLQQLIDSTQTISQSFNEVSDHVKMLDNRLEEIGEITHAINSISDQTNLLALNAAIEAARAGEAGKGFAVVADEIRKLAEQSKNSSVHINELLSNITNSSGEIIETTTKGIENLKGQEQVVHSTISSFKEILADISNVIPMIENANNSINIVDDSKNDIVARVDTIASISVDNSAIAQQIAASSEEMSASVEEVA
ncbi:Methyl-accepting chemotaxis protein, partial [Anaerovirgula multivorans]